jgi:predicted O-linked N-acetylglucosamine transferase (SPINDLY family)
MAQNRTSARKRTRRNKKKQKRRNETLTLSQALQRASFLLQTGKPTQALNILGAILKAEPKNFDGLQLSAIAEVQLGRVGRAVELYEAAVEIRQDQPSVYSNLGIALHELKRYEEAIKSYQRALELKPDYPEAHSNLGNALKALERHDEAIKSYQRALELKPEYPEAHSNLGNALKALERHDEAIKSYQRALELKPEYPDAHNNLGNALLRLERHDEAIKSYQRALELKPEFPEAHSNLGNVLQQRKRHDEAIESYQRALKLKPDFPGAHNNLGNALLGLERYDDAIKSYQRALKLKPDYPEAHNNLGNALLQLERHDEAIKSYQRALELKPDFPEAYSNLGDALLQLERRDEAIKSYQRALELKPDFPEAHSNLGNALKALKRLDEAIESYLRALELEPDYPETHNNLGNALLELKRHDQAIECYHRALKLKPDYPKAHNNLGNALLELKRRDEAIERYQRALELDPDYMEAHSNLGNALQELKRHDEAIESYQRALELKPDDGDALSQLAIQKRHVCDWTDFRPLLDRLEDSLKTNQDGITPFVLLEFSDDPAGMLECARKFCLKHTGQIKPLEPLEPGASDGRIRVAFLSADFHEHATAYLMSELFERHDRDKFELHAISFGVNKKSATRSRLERAFDHWHEVSGKSDFEIAQLIRESGIHIALELKGYTANSRPGVLAHRPAPIQVNYLGYPGTIGGDFIDYILVDDFLVPSDQAAFFKEKLAHLPNSYQVNDSKRAITEETPDRHNCGLPDEGFVFCSFNINRKITPTVFDVWTRLLREVEDSVLWLLEDNKWAKENLRKEAKGRDVDPDRLIFAPRKPLPDHLARQRQADLFLDTLPCNAHTTASDALWAGLPVLTCAGRSFHARVAGSLLRAVDLPELITTNLEDYEALALKLAREPDLLEGYRKRLTDNRDSAPLFDCARFTRNLEAAYQQMWRRWREGKEPEAFSVSESAESDPQKLPGR